MKPVLCAFFGLLAATSAGAQARDTSPDVTKRTCTVAGMVIKLVDSAPVKKATVRLVNTEQHEKSVITGVDGKFLLENIEPGRYSLSVVRNGYVRQEYGQHHSGDPAAVLTLLPGQKMSDLVFKLVPSAVISGRVLDEDGDPLRWVHMTAFRWSYYRGKRTFSSETEGSTDDLGEYRLFDLVPGRYFLSARYEPGASIIAPRSMTFSGMAASEWRYVTAYYPNTSDPAKAAPITVKAGDEVRSIDFLLTPSPLGVKVRGRVFNAVTGKSGGSGYVWLESRDQQEALRFERLGAPTNKSDGSFEISNVLPGSYDAVAMWNYEGKRYTANQALEVGNADVEGILLTIAPGLNIAGRLNWDNKPDVDASELRVILSGVGEERFFNGPSIVKADGSFVLTNVSEGHGRVVVSGVGKDTFIKIVRYAGDESATGEVNVRRGTDSALEVTLSSRGGHLEGVVTNSDSLPAAGVWVVLIPDPPLRNRDWFYKQTTTDQYGRFILRGITPGDYKLFSWDEVEEGAWEDASFLKPFEEESTAVHVEEGDSKTVNLNAMDTKKVQEQNP